ncbi:hypothetical protein NLM59_04420 [Weeksellaceae bacterium KMM 9724]|uniref:hypothetical protein n=1 Tax=Profundicola chukchiensis TaxID=2961959 RepID=UPI002437572B|nr:hypothetical protein [Profundicola chukchiensis]MDG4950158.1 hypothetical protein [Profundicola chukchiensis]
MEIYNSFPIPIAIGNGYVSYAQIPELQDVNKFSYIFNYTNPLGNVRLSYAENPKILGNIVILDETEKRGSRIPSEK